ncbi:MAG: tRNA guanosine(34) transglycosylase Tgt [Candidatus Nealsonbacteria bacterium]
MIEFKIVKKSKKSKARLGLLKTSHGVVETPCFVPVATQAAVKSLDNKEILDTKSQILICNTFHLHIRPGGDLVKKFGGLHKFMNLNKPLMTDSGGFQVFSLGFGKDLGTGKILKNKKIGDIDYGQQPKLLKITDKGVYFRSFLDGKELFLGPKESIKIQEKLGADIIFAFDECTSPMASKKYTKASLLKTHKWAEICLKEKKTKQALYGIVQGGKFKGLRKESARFIGSLPFDGFGIGGEFGDDKKTMIDMLKLSLSELPENKPRHLLGIGYLKDIPKIIKAGVDTFDCIVPTHYARRGIAFTSLGELDLNKKVFSEDKKSLDPKCSCFVCKNHTRGYIHHLFRAKEITGMKLLTFHNLHFFNSFVENIRKDIKRGKI